MKQILIPIVLFISTYSFEVNAESDMLDFSAESVSKGKCQGYEMQMGQLFSFRQQEIPIDTAEETWNFENNVNVRVFLKNFTKELYKNPEAVKRYMDSGKFSELCIKAHSGS